MEIAWQFEYLMSQEKLENLYKKAKETQWNSDDTLDWSIQIDPSKTRARLRPAYPKRRAMLFRARCEETGSKAMTLPFPSVIPLIR